MTPSAHERIIHPLGGSISTIDPPFFMPRHLTIMVMARYNERTMWAKQKGFTIVEVIVVIVVIGILAAVTLVAYNGSQERARFASYKSDMVRINDALTVYQSENGRYPLGDGTSASGCTTYSSGNQNFISGLYPSYINPMPTPTAYGSGANYYAYCWTSSGAEYKLLRIVPTGKTVPLVEQNVKDVTQDPGLGWRAWGFWSPGGSSLGGSL